MNVTSILFQCVMSKFSLYQWQTLIGCCNFNSSSMLVILVLWKTLDKYLHNVRVQYCYNVYNQHWYEVILKSLNLKLISSKTSNPCWLQSINVDKMLRYYVVLYMCNGDGYSNLELLSIRNFVTDISKLITTKYRYIDTGPMSRNKTGLW